MNARTSTFYISVIGMIGAAAAIVNSICPGNSTALVGIVILTASAALFIALLADVLTINIVNAVINKDRVEQISVLSAVIGRTLVDVLKEEKEKENK